MTRAPWAWCGVGTEPLLQCPRLTRSAQHQLRVTPAILTHGGIDDARHDPHGGGGCRVAAR